MRSSPAPLNSEATRRRCDPSDSLSVLLRRVMPEVSAVGLTMLKTPSV